MTTTTPGIRAPYGLRYPTPPPPPTRDVVLSDLAAIADELEDLRHLQDPTAIDHVRRSDLAAREASLLGRLDALDRQAAQEADGIDVEAERVAAEEAAARRRAGDLAQRLTDLEGHVARIAQHLGIR